MRVTVYQLLRIAAGVCALALVPAAWILTMNAVPSFAQIRLSHTADIVGVWVFTWALTWTASICGIAIAWTCWGFDAEDAAERARTGRSGA